MLEFNLQDKEYIELNKLLKILSLAESGGQANLFITNGEVLLNETTETQKRKKLRKGDVIQIFDATVKII